MPIALSFTLWEFGPKIFSLPSAAISADTSDSRQDTEFLSLPLGSFRQDQIDQRRLRIDTNRCFPNSSESVASGRKRRARMDAHWHRLAIVAALVLLASAAEEALAVRSPGALLAPRSSPDALPSARLGTPEKERTGTAAAGAGAGSAPSAVFDPDRMSKRRVRRGSDPIHNKC